MILKIDKNNFEMDYIKFGKGSKNIIMIPGVSIKSVMESEKLIAEAYDLFSNDYTIYVFDRIKNMNKNYSISEMANDMIKALDILKLSNSYFLGASQGGMISLLIAIKRPDLVKKLCVSSVTYSVSNETYKFFEKLINLSKENKLFEVVGGFSEKVYSKELYDNIKGSLKAYADSITEYDKERFIIQCEALKNFDIKNELNKIQCETFIITSKFDKIFNYNDSILISKIINKSSIFIYSKYSHAVYDEAPDIKNKILDFYND